jgi:hypothetical protein
VNPEAICISCGTERRVGSAPCERCGFDPRESEESTCRSIYLSIDRFAVVSDEVERVTLQEAWQERLPSLGASIASGKPIEYPEAELEAIGAFMREAQGVPASRMTLALLRVFAPLALGIAAVWLLVWLLG